MKARGAYESFITTLSAMNLPLIENDMFPPSAIFLDQVADQPTLSIYHSFVKICLRVGDACEFVLVCNLSKVFHPIVFFGLS